MTGRRRRLLVLASTFPGSPEDGTPAFVRDLALEEAKEFDTLVVVPRVPGASRTERIDGVRVVRFPYFFRRWETLADGAIMENLRSNPLRWGQVVPFLLAEALATARALRAFRPDVVHAHWVVPQGLVASVVARSVPRLLTSHGADLYSLRSRPVRALLSRVVRGADHTTVVNAEMLRTLRTLGVPPDRVSVLPMGAAIHRDVTVRDASEGEAVRLVFVGRLVEKKGLEVLLAAIRDLKDVAVELVVAGDGPLRSRLEAQASDLPVRFLGQVGRSELEKVLRACDIAVVPSVPAASGDQDGLPVTLLEAMAYGLPVVASDLPGIDEAVEHDVSGLLVPAGDAARLGDAIAALARDPARRARMGARGGELAEQFSVEAVGARYRELLRQLAP